jgi:hypothetical protein
MRNNKTLLPSTPHSEKHAEGGGGSLMLENGMKTELKIPS